VDGIEDPVSDIFIHLIVVLCAAVPLDLG